MAEGAYERARHAAAARVLAFAKLAEARADDDPPWLACFIHDRLTSDVVETHRDLAQPEAALRWSRGGGSHEQGPLHPGRRVRTAVVSAAYMQAGTWRRDVASGHQAVDILAGVQSARDYVG